MKKKILVIAAILLCLSFGIASTTAYHTTQEKSHNVITTGKIDIEIEKYALNGAGDKIPSEDTHRVLPGAEISKVVQVKNVDEQPAYIRVKIEKEITLADDSTEADLGLMKLSLNTKDWTEKDGYYYYNKVLAAGKTTEPIITAVIFDGTMGNVYQDSMAAVKIKAYAVQEKNNGADSLEAQGWPED